MMHSLIEKCIDYNVSVINPCEVAMMLRSYIVHEIYSFIMIHDELNFRVHFAA